MSSYWRLAMFMARGLQLFTKQAYEKSKTSFTDSLTHDLDGFECVVTGANSGLGFYVTKHIISRRGKVHMVCRNPTRASEARQRLLDEVACSEEQLEIHIVDMSSMAQVEGFVKSFQETNTCLHALINNAGLMENKRTITDEGLEYNFAVNVMGTFLMTEGLIPLMKTRESHQIIPTADSKGAELKITRSGRSFIPRVIIVSSGGMMLEDLNLDDPQGLKLNNFSGQVCYSRNKRIQVCLGEIWGKMHNQQADDGIIIQSMHPGWADTPGVARSIPDFKQSFQGKLRTSQEGADTINWLATSEEISSFSNGAFFLDRVPQSKHLFGCWSEYKDDELKALYDMLSARQF